MYSEENEKKSPYKTLITSNCILTTYHSDNHNQQDYLMTSPANKQKSEEKTKNEKEPDIITSIKTLGNIIAQNGTKNSLISDDVTKLNQLNCKLQNIEINQDVNEEKDYKNSRLNSYINDSKNLLIENNMIRRDTFIDNNFNKKFRLYEKDVIIEEINKNSDMRLKKYGILFDFIGNNIKELTELVTAQSQIKNEETKFNKNTNSKIHRVKGKALSIDTNSNPIKLSPRKILTDFDKSMIETSKEEEFFHDLLDHNFVNLGNFSNEMSSLRSRFDISLFGNKIDQTQQQYEDNTNKNNKNIDGPSCYDDTYTVPEEMEGSKIRKNTPSFINKIDPHQILKQVREAQKIKIEKQSIYSDATKTNITDKLLKSESLSKKSKADVEKSMCHIF